MADKARRGGRGKGGSASAAAAEVTIPVPSWLGYWKYLLAGAFVLWLVANLSPSYFWFAFLTPVVIIIGVPMLLGVTKTGNLPSGESFWKLVKANQTVILWAVVLVWLLGFTGVWRLIWEPGEFVSDLGYETKMAIKDMPTRPEWLRPSSSGPFNGHFIDIDGDGYADSVPNYWLNFQENTIDEAKEHRNSASVRSCEAGGHLAAALGGANRSGPVGKAELKVDDAPTGIIGIVCAAGPNGVPVLLATEGALEDFRKYKQDRVVAGIICEDRPGWSCVELAADQNYVVTTPGGKCFQDDFRQGISVKGQVTTDAGAKLWTWRENGPKYSAIMAENWSSVPRAYYYRLTDKPATGCPAPA